jgi:two-component system, OmpR family, osmolarity sensor histidine kinase EnvZ
MGVLQRILPRGLYWRAALILLVPIVTIQLVVSTAFIQRHYEGVTRQMTNGVAIDLMFLLSEIEAAGSAEAAAERVGPLGRALEVTLTIPAGPSAPVEDRFRFLDLSGQVIVQTLRDRLPGLVVADVADPERVVNLLFETSVGPVQAELSRRRMAATNPHQLLVVMIFTSLLMTLIAFVFMRNQLRPITKLAAAAEDFGKGRTVPYRPRGALEVRAAGRAFLDMRARIERQIEQRTLMLSGVSHDLRTPLTRLRLGLSMMQEDPEVAALQQDVLEMQRMVDEFLAFVRGDAMEGTELTDAVALVEGVIARLGPKVRLMGVEGEAQPVEMRPMAVARAVENLGTNAERYGETVEVRLEFLERSLKVTVEDDGPGIPEDRREEALRPFTRLEEGRNPNIGGVGLGLTIAADIAMSHGGALRLSESARLGGLRADLVIAR